MKVLHIEDRQENLILVRKVLEAKGHIVHDARDGLMGLELARGLEADLILVDINIPAMNGYEVVTRLRADPAVSNAPIVAITAEGDRDRALALGFDGFISKPIRMKTFEGQLVGYLDGHRETVDDSIRSSHLLQHSQQLVDRLESRVRELERVNGRLREVDRLKLAVLRNVSHELATPMTPIMGYLKMLMGGELGPLTTEQDKVVDRISGCTLRLKGLIDDLLKATRFATGSVALEVEAFPPRELIDEAVRVLGASVDANGVQLEVSYSDQALVVADRAHCLTALVHLIGNAIKFGPTGGRVGLRAWTESTDQGGHRNWVVAVTDEGPGIPSDEREHVIQPFYQSDSSPTRLHGGAGLGLAIASRTAASHGGTLTIDDSENTGCMVVFRIPILPGNANDLPGLETP